MMLFTTSYIVSAYTANQLQLFLNLSASQIFHRLHCCFISALLL